MEYLIKNATIIFKDCVGSTQIWIKVSSTKDRQTLQAIADSSNNENLDIKLCGQRHDQGARRPTKEIVLSIQRMR